MTQCQIVLEVTVADCSTQLVQRRKMNWCIELVLNIFSR